MDPFYIILLPSSGLGTSTQALIWIKALDLEVQGQNIQYAVDLV
jgi:hypothetical protein